MTTGNQENSIRHLPLHIAIGVIVGSVAGVLSFCFLRALDWATRTRISHGGLIWLLPAAGLVVGVVYRTLGGRASKGNELLWTEVHDFSHGVPRRMAPLVFIGGVITHLFGGSAGREGAALQMTASVSDGIAKMVRLNATHRRTVIVASFAGGFGAIFGVPMGGAVFALEAPFVGGMHIELLVPSITASVVGDMIVRGMGYHHSVVIAIPHVHLTAALIAKVCVAGFVFGFAARVFVKLTHIVKTVLGVIPFAPVRLMLGGFGVLLLVVMSGTRDYLGLSLPLIDRALSGEKLIFAICIWKLVFTAVTVGSGFPGGEVTPLFCIGATLGAALAAPLGLSPLLAAALGYVAVFGAAANTPVALAVIGVELFGVGAAPLFLIACAVAYVVSPHTGIYTAQRPFTRKA